MLKNKNSTNGTAALSAEPANTGTTGSNGQKPKMSKRKKTVIIASTTVAVLILAAVLTVVLLLFTGGGGSAGVDTDALAIDRNGKYYLGTTGTLEADGGTGIILDFAFPGATDFSFDAKAAKIEQKTIGGTARNVLKPFASSGSFHLEFSLNGEKEKLEVNILPDGYNVYEISGFAQALKSGSVKKIVLQGKLTAFETKGFVLKDMVIYGNGFAFDATKITAEGGNTLFEISGQGGGVEIRDLHIVGEAVIPNGEENPLTLDEFEGNGALFYAHGTGEERPKLTVSRCIAENGHKLAWISNADVTIEKSLFRNASDAIIAVQTTTQKGAVLTLRDNILSNSVVAGVLFCGWDDIGANRDLYRCTLKVEGFLDIYNWKDGKTAKLVPATEDAATLVNKMVAGEIRRLTNDEEAVKEYMVKEGEEFYVHIGIILLATPNLDSNDTTVIGADAVGFKMRRFPIPEFAKVIARTCQLIGYTQDTAQAENAVKPTDRFTQSKHFTELGYKLAQ